MFLALTILRQNAHVSLTARRRPEKKRGCQEARAQGRPNAIPAGRHCPAASPSHPGRMDPAHRLRRPPRQPSGQPALAAASGGCWRRRGGFPGQTAPAGWMRGSRQRQRAPGRLGPPAQAARQAEQNGRLLRTWLASLATPVTPARPATSAQPAKQAQPWPAGPVHPARHAARASTRPCLALAVSPALLSVPPCCQSRTAAEAPSRRRGLRRKDSKCTVTSL